MNKLSTLLVLALLLLVGCTTTPEVPTTPDEIVPQETVIEEPTPQEIPTTPSNDTVLPVNIPSTDEEDTVSIPNTTSFDNDSVDIAKSNAIIINLDENFKVDKKDLTIKIGDTVTWKNNMANFLHIIAWIGLPKTTPIKFGEEFTYTFTEPGEYKWFSTAKPVCQGIITVEE